MVTALSYGGDRGGDRGSGGVGLCVWCVGGERRDGEDREGCLGAVVCLLWLWEGERIGEDQDCGRVDGTFFCDGDAGDGGVDSTVLCIVVWNQ